MTLTFGLRGEIGIQKSILIGAPSGTNGVYSMIQGQDMVFVLPKTTVDILTNDFLEEVR